MTKLIFGLLLLEQQQSGNALSTGLGYAWRDRQRDRFRHRTSPKTATSNFE